MLNGLFFLIVCRLCGNGDLVMPFDSAAERGKWASAHTAGTGHARWFVTESDHRLSKAELAVMLARSDALALSLSWQDTCHGNEEAQQ